MAAAVIALSSANVGITIIFCLEILDIVFDLTTVGPAETNDPSHRVTLHKSDIIEDRSLRCESDHTQFTVLEAIINPN